MAHGQTASSANFKSTRSPPPGYETTVADQGLVYQSPPPGRLRRSFEPLNENSPLLSPQYPEDGDAFLQRPGTPADILDWNDEEAEESKSVWYLFLLTLSIGG